LLAKSGEAGFADQPASHPAALELGHFLVLFVQRKKNNIVGFGATAP
jgi:hypothetical protein